jgi:chorismate dehydratase
MARLRISAISYLNTAPLMWDFRHGHPDFDISFTVPAQCAAELERGAADIGIIPAAAYANIPGLVIIPDVAIASKSAVRSILLVSKVPLKKIRTVALDNSSLTSVALVQILFAKWWGSKVSFSPAAPRLSGMLELCDAALVIGDTALQVDRSQYLTFDLAEEWIKFTGKAFVFAFWAIREAALGDSADAHRLAGLFQQSRDHGLESENINRIAAEWAPRLGLCVEDIKIYLTQNIYYSLDSACLDGLRLFYRYGKECGVLPDVAALRFLETAKFAFS